MPLKSPTALSFNTINEVVNSLRNKMGNEEISYAAYALNEQAIQKKQVRFVGDMAILIIHEVVPLDAYGYLSDLESQVYINSGTWHSYYAIAAKNHLMMH